MHRRLSIIAILVTLACDGDPTEPAAVCEPDWDYHFLPGETWGPCSDDQTCYEPNSQCTENVCAPSERSDHPRCAETVDLSPFGFLQACDQDVDCVPGQVCDLVYCVWP